MASMSSLKSRSSSANTRIVDGSARAVWHKSAPASVRRAFRSGNAEAGWAAWQRHLAGRKRRVAGAKRSDAPVSLVWGFADQSCASVPVSRQPPTDSRTKPEWLDRTGPPLERGLLTWLGESAGSAAGVDYALEALACCHALPRLAAVLSSEVWWALLDHLLCAVADAGGIELDRDPLAHQLLAGELALTLGGLLPEITPCRKLLPAARRALSAGLVDLLDGEGLPHGKHLALLRPLLACWTRCRAVGEKLQRGCWSKSAQTQYEWLVRQGLRLARRDGTQVFSARRAADRTGELFEAALRFGGDDDDRDIAALVLPRRNKAGKREIDESALPEAANHSEWASVAVLRPNWSRSEPRLTAVYEGKSLRIELDCGKDVLFSGTWELDVRLGGRPAAPADDYEDICWVSDDDVDYLELEIELTGQIRVGRQMLLAREDRFLFLADAILGPRPGKLEYRGRLPLCSDISFQRAGQTREGFLTGSKRRALVLPLGLPEWRTDKRIGELTRTDRGLELYQSLQGACLYAPLFFDLDRRRMTRRPTWRQLTVAESLAVVAPEVAAGYRVAAGRRQWLVYRSLATSANRTLLGHNLSSEMLVANFQRSGEVDPLLEIE